MENLRVSYGSRDAVKGLSLKIMAGESLGLLGVNGAGKTSTIRAVLGMIRYKADVMEVFGEKAGTLKAKKLMGFAPEDGTPPEFLKVGEYLKIVAGIKGLGRSEGAAAVAELLDWFELEGKLSFRACSKGMKKRVVLAQAFLGDPKFLIFDEPLNGLDPLIIQKLRTRILREISSGKTILYSSHILSEVEKCCSRVVILRKGAMVYSNTVAQTVSEFGSVESAFSKLMQGEALL